MAVGAVIAGRFEVQLAIRRGGMSTVYRALDRRTGEHVALKILGEGYEHEVERFVREAIALERLHHPAIVRYVAHGQDEREPGLPPIVWLAMEWLDGEDVATRLHRARLTIPESVTLVARVASALATAHAAGLVHRDIKPSNLFLADQRPERVKVIDFGIARFADRAELTGPGVIFGTAGYMSPEQARGERRIDARADVFALGCVLFECVAHRPVFTGAHATAVLAKVVLEDAPRLRSIRGDVPEALDRLVSRMLAKVPASRPSEMREIAEELEALSRTTIEELPESSLRAESIGEREQRLVGVVMAGSKEPPPPDATIPMSATPTAGPEGFEGLRAALAPLGAQLECLRNGSLVATVLGRGNASDQAARAARCALLMRERLVEVPIVLAMGRGVIGARLPVGEVIDRAVEQMRATPAEDRRGVGRPVRLDAITAALLDARFEVSREGTDYLLRDEREAAEESRTLLGKTTPCVGRDRELSLLRLFLDEVIEEKVARAVLVTAPAGFGKSRLRWELTRAIEGAHPEAEVWIARGDPMSAGSPFGLVAQLVRRAVGVRDGEPIELRRQTLRAYVETKIGGKRAPRVTQFLGELVGVRFGDDESVQLRAARQDAMLMGDQMRAAWEDLLEGVSAEKPIVLLVEDLHWGDLPSVQFIDAALRNLRDRPIFVLALGRPEVHELFPGLWSGRGVQEVRLGELTKKASTRLVVEVLGEKATPAIVEKLVERAAGNAYYLEELIRAVAEGKTDVLPESVLASVQARLERFEPDARRVLRAASVFGQVFWRSGVERLLGGDSASVHIDAWIAELLEREAIVRRSHGKFPGEDEYAFRHGLLREGAYAMLTDQDRKLGHLMAGEWLEHAGESDAMALAEHFERGGEHQRAIRWYRRAAEHALEGNDYEAVVSRAERAVACGASGDVLGHLRVMQAEAHRWRGDLAGAEACSLDAMRLVPRCSPQWFAAVGDLALASGRRGKTQQLVVLGEMLGDLAKKGTLTGQHAVASARAATQILLSGNQDLASRLIDQLDALATGEESKNPGVAARMHVARYYRAICTGDVGAAFEHAHAAVENFERVGDLRGACNNRGEVGYTLVELGAYDRAVETFREVITTAERLGRLQYPLAVAKHNLGIVLARRGEIEDALAVEKEALEAFQAKGDRRLEGCSRIFLAKIHLLNGDVNNARREAQSAVQILSVAPPARAHALATSAQVELARGDAARALDEAEQANALLEELGVLDDGESFVRLTHAEALDRAGDHEAARETIAVARERLLARAGKIRDPEMRRCFLERVPENARTMELAATWIDRANLAAG